MAQVRTEREAGYAAATPGSSPIMQLIRNWRAVSFRGAFLVGLGLLLLAHAFELRHVATLLAVLMAADGARAAVSALRAASRGERWGGLAAEGLLDWAAAGAAALSPGIMGLSLGYVAVAMAAPNGPALLAGRQRLLLGQAMMVLTVGVSVLFGMPLAS